MPDFEMQKYRLGNRSQNFNEVVKRSGETAHRVKATQVKLTQQYEVFYKQKNLEFLCIIFLNPACGDCFVKGSDLCNSAIYKLGGKIHRGAFNNYVDQILTNFDPLPLEWTSMDIF